MNVPSDPVRETADTWWSVDEPGAVAAVRRAATALAEEVGLGSERAAEVGIVVTELATNLVRHAGGGELVLRAVGDADHPALRVLAIDSGPGSRDIEALISDGASTRGTLGIGLGACRRLSTAFDIYSVPAVGTLAEAVLGREAATGGDTTGRDTTGGDTTGGAGIGAASGAVLADLTRPLSGEGPCGDTTAHRTTGGALLAMVADGLGHGPLAAQASRRAAEVFLASDLDSPAAALDRLHVALAGTRGAAIAVVRYVAGTGTLTHAGVGNVVTRLVGGDAPRSLASQPGIVGHRMPRLREVDVTVGDHAALVMHSDGLSHRWTLDDEPDVLTHRPAVVCAALLRAASNRRDDAGILVLRTAA